MIEPANVKHQSDAGDLGEPDADALQTQAFHHDMNSATETLGPDIYERWRATPLGALTEALESRVVFQLTGALGGRRVLDVGTGDGTYAIEAAMRGATVTAVDTSSEMLQAARLRASNRRVSVDFHEGDIRSLPFEAERFDVVLAVTVLCSVGDVASAFRELARVLAPGGRLVVGELGRWSTWAVKRRDVVSMQCGAPIHTVYGAITQQD